MHGLLLLLYSLLLLLLHSQLLLLLHSQLLSLELVLPGLKLCKCSGGLLCLASLILPHTLKYGK